MEQGQSTPSLPNVNSKSGQPRQTLAAAMVREGYAIPVVDYAEAMLGRSLPPRSAVVILSEGGQTSFLLRRPSTGAELIFKPKGWQPPAEFICDLPEWLDTIEIPDCEALGLRGGHYVGQARIIRELEDRLEVMAAVLSDAAGFTKSIDDGKAMEGQEL